MKGSRKRRIAAGCGCRCRM
ncbi:hypothetical protein LNO81_22540 [Klebsiella variicola subsp. variicola]|nr:hypothetical protein [Klebsiella variicola subsp. variicola]